MMCRLLFFLIAFSFSCSLFSGPIQTPKAKWIFQTRGSIRAGAIADHENVYFGSSDGYLYSVRKSDGSLAWKFQTQGAITASPATGDGLVIISSRDNYIYAVEAGTGTLKWKFQMQPIVPYEWHWEYYSAAPVINNGQVLVGSGDGNLYALSVLQGKLQWKFKTGGRLRATPLVDKDVVYQPGVDGVVYAVSAKDGSLLWKFETDGAIIDSKKFGWDRNAIYSKPALKDSLLVIGARDGMAYAINIYTHKEKWRNTYGPSWAMSAAIDNDLAYFGWSDNDLISAFDLKTGKEKWEFDAGSFVYSTPVFLGDEVFFNSGNNKIYCLNKMNGEKRWEYETDSPMMSTPLLDGNVLFAGNDNGKMYAIEDGVKPVKVVFQPIPSSQQYDIIFTVDKKIAPYLMERGFQQLDSAKLYSFLTNRISDKAPSVVVFSYGLIPENILGTKPGKSLIRKYLDAGGKIVWLGNAPPNLLYNEKGRVTGLDNKSASAVLEIDFIRVNENGNYYSKTTSTGVNWGFPEWFTSTFANVNAEGVIPLAFDEYNRVSAWLKKYNPRPGSGYVSFRSWSFNTAIKDSDLKLIHDVAVHELE